MATPKKPMAVRVDKRLIAERRVNNMFDGAAQYNRRKTLRRKPMATLRMGAQ